MALFSRKLILPAVILLGAGCTQSHSDHALARKAASSAQPALELGEQWGEDEENHAQDILALTLQMLAKKTESETYVHRDAHPKQHGCVQANFKMDSSALPAELRVGIFAPGARAENPAWIRFSNGSPDGASAPDLNKDIRGMAIKLMNVPGSKSGSQDLVLITSEKFFSHNQKDYVAFHEAMSRGSTASALHFIAHPSELRVILGAQVRIANPLQGEYFSSVPYKLGNRSMRFKAVPCADSAVHDTLPGSDATPNFLRERLASTLQQKSACFEFFVQPNMDPDANPVEDPVKKWDETKSPYYKVAKITIPVQDGVATPEHLNFCENLSFDPWHSLPETRPLGQINRTRLIVYPAISEFRHQQNHIPILEPKTLDACGSDTAALCEMPRI